MPEEDASAIQLPRTGAVPPELIEPFARMAGLVLSDQTLNSILELVASLSAHTIPGVDGASVSLVDGGRVRTAVHTDETIRLADGDQYELDEGPCLHAIRSGEPTHLESTGGDERWPGFVARAGERGIGSVLSMPLQLGERSLGALNLYSRRPGPFDERAQFLSSLFAQHAAIVIANAEEYVSSRERAEQLLEALQTRDVIGQAKGIIISSQRCSSDEAFDILRRASQRENRKLRDVARDIVERAQRRDR